MTHNVSSGTLSLYATTTNPISTGELHIDSWKNLSVSRYTDLLDLNSSKLMNAAVVGCVIFRGVLYKELAEEAPSGRNTRVDRCCWQTESFAILLTMLIAFNRVFVAACDYVLIVTDSVCLIIIIIYAFLSYRRSWLLRWQQSQSPSNSVAWSRNKFWKCA